MHSEVEGDNPFLNFEKDNKKDLSWRTKPTTTRKDCRVTSFIFNHTPAYFGSLARPSSSCQAEFQHNKNTTEYILENEWKKQNKLVIVLTLMDVSYLFEPDAKNAVKDKFTDEA